MLGIIALGLLLGMMAASLSKDFRPRHLVGWIVIATFGALEGKFLVSLFNLQSEMVPIFTAACTLLGAISLIWIKFLFKPKELSHDSYKLNL